MNKCLFLKITTLGCEKHHHLDQKKPHKSLDTDEERMGESEEELKDSLGAGAEVGVQRYLQN